MDENTPKAVQDTHVALKWFLQKLDKFPRNRRFTLGERIESRLLDVLEQLIQASYQHENRVDYLTQANLHLEVIRHLWRIAYELEVIGMTSYKNGSKLLLELGLQVGGWQKHARRASQ
jgi:hypothetical protein